MALVTTLHSRRSQEIDEEEAHPARAAVPRKARHARDPAGASRDGPRSPVGPGLGLADADPHERQDRAPARAREARVRPRRPGGSTAAHAGGEGGGDQVRRVPEAEPVQGGQGRAAAELCRAGADAGLHPTHPEGARARAGRARTAYADSSRSWEGAARWVAQGIPYWPSARLSRSRTTKVAYWHAVRRGCAEMTLDRSSGT